MLKLMNGRTLEDIQYADKNNWNPRQEINRLGWALLNHDLHVMN